jgi:hypothetical protein
MSRETVDRFTPSSRAIRAWAPRAKAYSANSFSTSIRRKSALNRRTELYLRLPPARRWTSEVEVGADHEDAALGIWCSLVVTETFCRQCAASRGKTVGVVGTVTHAHTHRGGNDHVLVDIRFGELGGKMTERERHTVRRSAPGHHPPGARDTSPLFWDLEGRCRARPVARMSATYAKA